MLAFDPGVLFSVFSVYFCQTIAHENCNAGTENKVRLIPQDSVFVFLNTPKTYLYFIELDLKY